MMLQLSRKIFKVAQDQDHPVFIIGETGTGKEIVARQIHEMSGRTGSFRAINCAAMVENLIESELFGHEKGAFTGAYAMKRGIWEEAAQGTIFLDEITEASPSIQSKLLRVLQEGTIRRVGSNHDIKVTARKREPFVKTSFIVLIRWCEFRRCGKEWKTFRCSPPISAGAQAKEQSLHRKRCICFAAMTGPEMCANWRA